MKLIRWFGAEWRVALRVLASRMNSHAFHDDVQDGFLLERVQDNLVSGRYIEKQIFQETVTSPFGEERVLDRVLYNQLEFNLSPNFPNIEFFDGPRSAQTFINRLAEYSNFTVSVVPLSVDLAKWADAFQVITHLKMTVNSLQVSGLEIKKGVSATIVLSGERNLNEALELVAKNKPYELDRMQLKVMRNGIPVTLQISRVGTAKLDDALLEDFVPALRDSLPRP